MHEWPEDSDDMKGLRADIALRGIDDALKVTASGHIADGRHRWRAAKALQIEEVPVKIVDEEDVPGIILGSLTQRRHYGKGALAYMAFPLYATALAEARKRQTSNLKRGKSPERSLSERSGRKGSVSESAIAALSGITAEDLAEQLGVSRTLFFFAKYAHEQFSANPDLRDRFEPLILSGEIGLQRLKSAIAGKEYPQKGPQDAAPAVTLFRRDWEAFSKRAKTFSKHWDAMKREERQAARGEVVRAVREMSDLMRMEVARALDEVAEIEESKK